MFKAINDTDEMHECSVKMSFPLDDIKGYFSEAPGLRRSNIYIASYYSPVSLFFGFPIFQTVPHAFIRREGDALWGYNDLYLIYSENCDKRVELTAILNRWANRYVGIPLDLTGIKITADVTKEELRTALYGPSPIPNNHQKQRSSLR